MTPCALFRRMRDDARLHALGSLKRLLARPELGHFHAFHAVVVEFLIVQRGTTQAALLKMLNDSGLAPHPSVLSRQMARLERLGYVRREIGSDARTRRLVATHRGKLAVRAFATTLATHFPVAALKPTAFVIECPACSTALRLQRVGPSVLHTCPSCQIRFFVESKDREFVVRLKQQPHAVETPRRPPHEVLGVARGASKEHLREARRAALKKYHPDFFQRLDPEFVALATRRSQEINQAFEVLSKGG